MHRIDPQSKSEQVCSCCYLLVERYNGSKAVLQCIFERRSLPKCFDEDFCNGEGKRSLQVPSDLFSYNRPEALSQRYPVNPNPQVSISALKLSLSIDKKHNSLSGWPDALSTPIHMRLASDTLAMAHELEVPASACVTLQMVFMQSISHGSSACPGP